MLRGCRYETIQEMKEAVTKVIGMLPQEDFDGAFQKLLERYKCIAARGDYFEGDESFMCVLLIKVPIRKKFWKLILWSSYNWKKTVCKGIRPTKTFYAYLDTDVQDLPKEHQNFVMELFSKSYFVVEPFIKSANLFVWSSGTDLRLILNELRIGW